MADDIMKSSSALSSISVSSVQMISMNRDDETELSESLMSSPNSSGTTLSYSATWGDPCGSDCKNSPGFLYIVALSALVRNHDRRARV